MDLVNQESEVKQLVMTRMQLFNIIKEFKVKLIDKKLDFLQEHIQKLTNNDIKEIKSLLYAFRSEYKSRWALAHRKENRFISTNEEWLKGEIRFPNHTTQPIKKTGRPAKDFSYLSESSKRRKTKELRETISSSELTFATQMSLRAQGNTSASSILRDLTNSPRAAARIKRKIARASPQQLSGQEALSIFVEANLSRAQYDIIQQADKKRFPCYKVIQRCKMECYPDSAAITVTSSLVDVNLQALVNHTASRLSLYLNDVISQISELEQMNLVLVSKWGCDGSQQSRYKQKIEEGEDDSNIFLSSFMPIRLVSKCHGRERIIWQNPVPSSPRYCRPIRIKFIHESKDITKEETSYIKRQIEALQPTEVVLLNISIKIKHQLLFTMVDGKICNAVTDTNSTMRCYICGLTSKDFNKLHKRPGDPSTFEFGLSILRFLEFILHLAYRLPIKKWQLRSQEERDIKDATKKHIQDEFKKKMGLLIDIPKTGFGTTNDGNTARRFFANCTLSAEITKVDLNLIQRLAVILEVISSGKSIDTAKFSSYTQKTADLYVSLYSWFPMTPTVHKILQHGPEIIKYALLPIGQLSEEAAEARNKHFRDYRLNFSRKCSRKDCNRDILNRLLLTSDPLISSIRKRKSRKLHEFSHEAITMFKPEDNRDSDSSDDYGEEDDE